MKKHYTDAEIGKLLKRLEIIVDSREQVNGHVIGYLDKNGVPIISRKLDIGDYACQLDGNTFEQDFVIERKANLDELCGNLTADRNRFEREFLRARAFGTKVYLVIEDASWDDVYLQNYRSKLSAKSLLGSMLAWQTRYGITIVFCKKNNSPKLIHGILYYAAREIITGGV